MTTALLEDRPLVTFALFAYNQEKYIREAVAVDFAARWSEPLGAVLGLGLALATGILALLRLSAMAGAGGRLGRIARLGERVRGWMSRR